MSAFLPSLMWQMFSLIPLFSLGLSWYSRWKYVQQNLLIADTQDSGHVMKSGQNVEPQM